MIPFSVAKVIYIYILPQNSRLQARILAMRLASEAAGGAATFQKGIIYSFTYTYIRKKKTSLEYSKDVSLNLQLFFWEI